MEGRTVVVTGAASGIGRALALGFLREGATVLGVDRRAEGLEDVEKAGGLVRVADVSDDAAVRGFVAQALQATGRIDVLFNNAGYGLRSLVEDLEPGVFERLVAVHLFGTVYGMRAAIPHMRAQGYGRIVNTISRGAEASTRGASAYAAAKAGTWAASRTAAREVAGSGILINMLIPGPTNTGIWRRDMPQLQPPESVYPTARMLATLPDDGPNGKVFWEEREYPLFDPANDLRAQSRTD